MNFQVLKSIKENCRAQVLTAEPLAAHTTLKIGGPAEALVVPADLASLKFILKTAARYQIPLTIMGNGSNLLCPDAGLKGLVLKLAGGLAEIKIAGSVVSASALVLISQLLLKLQQAGLGGLEFAAGVPASLGGSVCENLGAFGSQISDFISSVSTLDLQGKEKNFTPAELNFRYRSSLLQTAGLIVTRVEFKLKPVPKEEIKTRMAEYLALRKEKAPLNFPNAGSIFKNPAGGFAAQFIEAAGCKGLRKGAAQISQKHANYIINLGKASAADVIWLIETVKQKVKDKFQIELIPEIKLAKFVDKNL